MSINEKTIKYLKEAGWYEGRKIDITEMVNYLEKRGFEIFEPVKRFLEEFGMLYIKIPDDEDSNYEYIEHYTDVIRAIGDYYTPAGFKQIEKYAGERLVPVGILDNDYLVLFVSESGRLCCETMLLGNTFLEGWDCVISDRPGESW